jgi:hypothetical protein
MKPYQMPEMETSNGIDVHKRHYLTNAHIQYSIGDLEMKTTFIILLSFLAAASGNSQDTTGTVVSLNEKIGPIIDLEERNYYQMFLSYTNFDTAVLLQRPDGSYIFKIISKKEDDTSVSIDWLPCANEELLRIRQLIDPFSKYDTTLSPDRVPVSAYVRVKDTEYGEIEGVTRINVKTKDGRKHEIDEFKFTENYLVGEEKSNALVIHLSDIDSVMIKGVRDSQGRLIPAEKIERPHTSGGSAAGAFVGAIAFGALAFIPSCALSLKVAEASGSTDLGTVLFFGLEIGAIILGGKAGYNVGKDTDEQESNGMMQQEQEREKAKKEKEGKKDKE